jgi:hypothetical protein
MLDSFNKKPFGVSLLIFFFLFVISNVYASSNLWWAAPQVASNTLEGNFTAVNVSGVYAWFDFFCLSGDGCISAWPAGGGGVTEVWIGDASSDYASTNGTYIDIDNMYINLTISTYINDSYNGSTYDYNISLEPIYSNITEANASQTAAELYNSSDEFLAVLFPILWSATTGNNSMLNLSMIDFAKNVNSSAIEVANASAIEAANESILLQINVSTIDIAQVIDLTNITLSCDGAGYLDSLTLTAGLLSCTKGLIVDEDNFKTFATASGSPTADTYPDTLTFNNGLNIIMNGIEADDIINVSTTETPKFVTLNLTTIGITNEQPNVLNITTGKGRIDIDADGNIRFVNGNLTMCVSGQTCQQYTTNYGVLVPNSESAFRAAAALPAGLFFQGAGIRGYNFTDLNGKTTFMINVQTGNISLYAPNGTMANCGVVVNGDNLDWACNPLGS